MNIVKTNLPFQRALGFTQDLTGRSLDELAASQESQSLHALRAQLRGERDNKEPFLLPPLLGPGKYEDAIRQVDESNLGMLSRGYDARHVQIRFRLPHGQYQYITARFQLARTSIIFQLGRTSIIFVVLALNDLMPYAYPAATTEAATQAPYGHVRPSTRSSVASSEAGSPPYALSTVTTPMSSRPETAVSPSAYRPSQYEQGYFPSDQPTHGVRPPPPSSSGGLNSYMTPAGPSRRLPASREGSDLRSPQLPVGRYNGSGQLGRTSAAETMGRVRTPEQSGTEPDPPNGGRRRRRRLDIREMIE